MDKGTTQQIHLDFARISIEVNAEDEIDKVIKVNIGDDQLVEVEVVIPWCPEKCKKCKQFGHTCKPNEEELVTPYLGVKNTT